MVEIGTMYHAETTSPIEYNTLVCNSDCFSTGRCCRSFFWW